MTITNNRKTNFTDFYYPPYMPVGKAGAGRALNKDISCHQGLKITYIHLYLSF